jgi:hypothetical protein
MRITSIEWGPATGLILFYENGQVQTIKGASLDQFNITVEKDKRNYLGFPSVDREKYRVDLCLSSEWEDVHETDQSTD